MTLGARVTVVALCAIVLVASVRAIRTYLRDPSVVGNVVPEASSEGVQAERRQAAVESLKAASKDLQDSVKERAARGELAETDEERTAAVLRNLDATEATIVGDSPWAKADRVSVGMTRDMLTLGKAIAKQNRELAAAGGLEILDGDTPDTLKGRMALLETMRATQSKMVKLLTSLREELTGRMQAAGVNEEIGARAVNAFLRGVGTGPALEFQLANERFLDHAHKVLSILIESPGWVPDGQGGATYPDMERQSRFVALWDAWDKSLEEMARRQREMLGVEVGTPADSPTPTPTPTTNPTSTPDSQPQSTPSSEPR